MRGTRGVARHARENTGAVLVFVALMLPVLIAAGGLVVDVGNWFSHKRHLQLEADAGALAGAGKFSIACDWSAIQAEAGRYSSVETAGPSWNPQIGGTPAANLHRMMNSPTFYNQASPVDNTVVPGDPCTNGSPMVDVKLTETDLPWFLKFAKIGFINAQARVEIQQKVAAAGSLPIGVPDVGPKKARAFFVDESNGTVLGSTPLSKAGTVNGLAMWSNSAAPVSVPISASHIGVRILLSGSASASPQCGDVLVDCYGAGTTSAIVAGTPGLVHIRGYSATPTGTATAPQDRDVKLSGGTCEDGYFTVSNPCTVNVSAIVDFGSSPPAVGTTRVSALVSGANANTQVDLTAPATITGAWTGGQIPIPAGSGATSVELRWKTGCPTNRNSACNSPTNSGVLGNVQRAYAGSEAVDVSGPIKQLLISENGNSGANSFLRDGTSHNLVVTLGLKPSLANAASVNDPAVTLKVIAGGGSQNQSLDCENRAGINFEDELTTGCTRKYKVNDGQTCPSTKGALAATAEPWNCVVVDTGAAVGQLVHGMNARIIGDRNASVSQCTPQFQNHWSSFPNLPPGDTRVVQVLTAPFGSFNGSGSALVPVTGFATFYVTGWDSSPCRNKGDDPAGNGELVGHFIKYVDTINNGGGGGGFCDLNAFGACVAVMTR